MRMRGGQSQVRKFSRTTQDCREKFGLGINQFGNVHILEKMLHHVAVEHTVIKVDDDCTQGTQTALFVKKRTRLRHMGSGKHGWFPFAEMARQSAAGPGAVRRGE
nr:hypothetical protein [uncultured Tateyamaria sp.]